MTIDILKGMIALADGREPVDVAKVCRQTLSSSIDYIFEKEKKRKPEAASMLELLDNSVVKEYISDSSILNSLHYIRILGANAEHSKRVKKTESELALDNIKSFVAFLECKETGMLADYIAPHYISEEMTRKLYIDLYLKEAGWDVLEVENQIFPGKAGIEIKVEGMPNPQGFGFCDYVLYGDNGMPLAIVEAKKTSIAPVTGKHQVDLYGDCMKAKYGYKPILYYTNGYQTYIMDGVYPDRLVAGFHSKEELALMLQQRSRGPITDMKVNTEIAGRHYQQQAITNLCEKFNSNRRRGLLVMATGTGKTRVSIALTDVLARNGWIKNVLFLADRTALVSQAKKNFAKLLPNMSVCELSGGGEKDLNARLMFCTYQTMINYIDSENKKFTVGRFDLIIIDEAHRSIFNKYGSIFNYFDSLLVGLTATPKDEVDANTYGIFGCESGVPNFDYSLEEAIKDHYLVPYKVVNRTTSLLKHGIIYDNLTEDEKIQLENYYKSLEEETMATILETDISSSKLFRKIYNETTCKQVLEDVMSNGIRVNQGETLGKTIIFAFNHHHADMIVKCFHELYPEYGANYCQLIDNQVNYADDLILKFDSDEEFRIAVSVDMLDTGIDVPAVVNLVFFKSLRSKIKFVQMIGRGTRLCPDLFGPGKDKTHFLIFDYCANFEYFAMHPDESNGKETISLSQKLFMVQLDLLYELQSLRHQQNHFAKAYYDSIKKELIAEVKEMKNHSERIQVRDAMEYVDRFNDENNWASLSALEVKIIKDNLTLLVDSGLKGDHLAVSFDIRMKLIEVALLQGEITDAAKNIQVVRKCCAFLLEKKATIPQVIEKVAQLKLLATEEYWQSTNLNDLETKRKELRDVMKFLEIIVLKWIDVNIGDVREDLPSDDPGVIDIRTYREKVLDYLLSHLDSITLRKIQNIEKIDIDDLKELERILWEELGTKEDYEEVSDTDNLAAFVRSIVGLNQDAINEKFGAYLTGNNFNSMQQEYIKTIIDYVRENGDITNQDLLEKSPFDDYDLIGMFGEDISTIVSIVNILHDSIVAA